MYQHRAFRLGVLASHHDHRLMKAAFAAAFRHDGWDQRPWPLIPQRGSIGAMNMAAQSPSGSPGEPALEERVHRLEAQMEALVEAVEMLALGLEDGPMAEPRNRHTEEAARRAHELLLLTKSAPPDRADRS